MTDFNELKKELLEFTSFGISKPQSIELIDRLQAAESKLADMEKQNNELRMQYISDFGQEIDKIPEKIKCKTCDGDGIMWLLTGGSSPPGYGYTRSACPECRPGKVIDNHDSDCATHNMPAYPNGECNCSLQSNDEEK